MENKLKRKRKGPRLTYRKGKKKKACRSSTREQMEKCLIKGKKVFKDYIDDENNLSFSKVDDIGSNEPEGLFKIKLSQKHFNSIKYLHELILERVGKSNMKLWASDNSTEYQDTKQAPTRCYGFLPHSKYESAHTLVRKGNVEMFAIETLDHERRKDQNANYNSSVSLDYDDIDSGMIKALSYIITTVRKKVAFKYMDCISLNNITTLQPNLSNETDYLKCHIDSPLNDGIGVVIVTICIANEADIILSANDDHDHYHFHLKEGEFYVLSGPSRNTYSHGVLCAEKHFGRESLNIRFGLHSKDDPNDQFYLRNEMPMFFFDDDVN